MPNLLLKIIGNPTLNRTIFPPQLYLYDDVIIYKKRSLLKIRENTLAYSHIVQVDLIKGIFFARIEIMNNGVENIVIKYISKKLATRAKKIIDQKMYFAHAKEKTDHPVSTINIDGYEKSLKRLKELLNKGAISQREYDQRREKYLNRME